VIYRLGAGASAFAAIIAFAAYLASDAEGSKLFPSVVLGVLLGIALQRSRFCFYCHWRDLISTRDPRGFVAILAALATGTVGYLVLFDAWLPDPGTGRLPPNAHIGPAGPVLAVAAFIFGIGMAISGSCVSGHLYRLGEGSPTAPFALAGIVGGFALGFSTWNDLYVVSIATSPTPWLPAQLGYLGWVILQLGVIAVLSVIVALLGRLPEFTADKGSDSPLRYALRRIFIDRWPATLGGAAVGLIGTLAYFQVQPLGVTSALGSVARSLSSTLGLLPETLHGLDGFAGCRTAVARLLTPNAAFVTALVLASFGSAVVAGQFQPAWPTRLQMLRGISGGVLLGWGAMTAIGCTVGTLLSGITAGAASGWIFFAASFAGVYASLSAAGAARSIIARRGAT